jgi:hypothetical protein
VIAIVLFIGSLSEVHYEIGVVKSKRFSDAQQVTVLINEANLSLLIARLDYPRLRQENKLRLGEENV